MSSVPAMQNGNKLAPALFADFSQFDEKVFPACDFSRSIAQRQYE
jgi:hypothetical protein